MYLTNLNGVMVGFKIISGLVEGHDILDSINPSPRAVILSRDMNWKSQIYLTQITTRTVSTMLVPALYWTPMLVFADAKIMSR